MRPFGRRHVDHLPERIHHIGNLAVHPQGHDGTARRQRVRRRALLFPGGISPTPRRRAQDRFRPYLRRDVPGRPPKPRERLSHLFEPLGISSLRPRGRRKNDQAAAANAARATSSNHGSPLASAAFNRRAIRKQNSRPPHAATSSPFTTHQRGAVFILSTSHTSSLPGNRGGTHARKATNRTIRALGDQP